MKVYIPNCFDNWLKEENPTEGEVMLIAAMTIFANIYGPYTYQGWEAQDLKNIIWDITEKTANNTQASSIIKKYVDYGIIESANFGLDVEVAMRLNVGGKLKAHQKSLISHKSVTEVEINDVRSIMIFSYFLGRIANLTEGMEVSELKKALNKKKFAHVIVPEVYSSQFHAKLMSNPNHNFKKIKRKCSIMTQEA
jgi:hypothetical protein